MDLFERQWATYRILVEHNLMEHCEISEATTAGIHEWLAQREDQTQAVAMVDLGCGDLGQLAPLLRTLPLKKYVGLDLTQAVLPLAQRNLGSVPYPCVWEQGDLLNWACSSQNNRVDLLHSSFALHHLRQDQKLLFLEGARKQIEPNGLFIWADVFRPNQESRLDYLRRYCQRINQWPGLSQSQRNSISQHIQTHDFPANRDWLEQHAKTKGWSIRWDWIGQHNAEAVALLQPIEGIASCFHGKTRSHSPAHQRSDRFQHGSYKN